MLRVLIGDVELDLAENSGWETRLQNPYFFTDFTERDYSFPFSVSATDAMHRLFGFVEDQAARVTAREYPAIVIIGEFSRSGILRVHEFTGIEYRVYLYLNRIEIDRNLRLSDLSLAIAGDLDFQVNLGTNNQWPDTPMYFPTLVNKRFYEDDLDAEELAAPDYLGIVNPYRLDSGLNRLIPNYVDLNGDAQNFYAAQPCPAVLEVLRLGLAANEYRLTGPVLQDPGMRALWMQPTQGLDYINDDPALTNSFGRYFKGLGGPYLNYNPATAPAILYNLTQGFVTGTIYETGVKGRVQINVFARVNNPSEINTSRLKVTLRKDGVQEAQQTNFVTIFQGAQETWTYSVEINVQDIDAEYTMHLTSEAGHNHVVEIVDFEATFTFVSGEIDLVRFKKVDNLADHLPNQLFSDFLNTLFRWRRITPIINERERTVSLHFQEESLQHSKAIDYSAVPFRLRDRRMDEGEDAFILRYRSIEGEGNSFFGAGTRFVQLWEANKADWTTLIDVPTGFKDRVEELAVAIWETPFLIDTFPISDVSTYVQALTTMRMDFKVSNLLDSSAGSSPTSLLLGLYNGRNGVGLCPATYITEDDLSLRLRDTITDDDIRGIHGRLQLWLDERNRRRRVIFFNPPRLPQPDERIIHDGIVYHWIAMNHRYSTDGRTELEIELL